MNIVGTGLDRLRLVTLLIATTYGARTILRHLAVRAASHRPGMAHPGNGHLATKFGGLGTAARLHWPKSLSAMGEWRRHGDARRLLGRERLAMVAHELRTPLGAIRQAVVLLEAAGDARPQVQAAC